MFTWIDGMISLGMPERRVARGAHRHELVLVDAVMDMDVVRALLGDRRLPRASARPSGS